MDSYIANIEQTISYENFLLSLYDKQNILIENSEIIIESKFNLKDFVIKLFKELIRAVINFFNKMIELINNKFRRPINESRNHLTVYDIENFIRKGILDYNIKRLKSLGRYIEFGQTYNYNVINDLFVKSALTLRQTKNVFSSNEADLQLIPLIKNKDMLKDEVVDEIRLKLLKLYKFYKNIYDINNLYNIDYLLRVNFGISMNENITETTILNSLESNKITIDINNIDNYKDIIINNINIREKMIKDIRKMCNETKDFLEGSKVEAERLADNSDYQELLKVYSDACVKYINRIETLTSSVIKASLNIQKEASIIVRNIIDFK